MPAAPTDFRPKTGRYQNIVQSKRNDFRTEGYQTPEGYHRPSFIINVPETIPAPAPRYAPNCRLTKAQWMFAILTVTAFSGVLAICTRPENSDSSTKISSSTLSNLESNYAARNARSYKDHNSVSHFHNLTAKSDETLFEDIPLKIPSEKMLTNRSNVDSTRSIENQMTGSENNEVTLLKNGSILREIDHNTGSTELYRRWYEKSSQTAHTSVIGKYDNLTNSVIYQYNSTQLDAIFSGKNQSDESVNHSKAYEQFAKGFADEYQRIDHEKLIEGFLELGAAEMDFATSSGAIINIANATLSPIPSVESSMLNSAISLDNFILLAVRSTDQERIYAMQQNKLSPGIKYTVSRVDRNVKNYFQKKIFVLGEQDARLSNEKDISYSLEITLTPDVIENNRDSKSALANFIKQKSWEHHDTLYNKIMAEKESQLTPNQMINKLNSLTQELRAGTL